MAESENRFTAVVVVQARMGSSRLPGKMMADLAGRPLLWHILQRARRVRPGLPVVLATTDQPRDQVLVEVAAEAGVHVVRGSEEDVFSRFMAVLDRFPARWLVRICGDSPLFDPAFLDHCLTTAEQNEADVVKFAGNQASLFQGGEVVSIRALRYSQEVAGQDALVREHVTAWAMRHAEEVPQHLTVAYLTPVPGMMEEGKLSIDTAEDLAALQTLYEALYRGGGILDLSSAARWIHDGGWR